jgi:glutamate-5-semialdehyde dehydrogenase
MAHLTSLQKNQALAVFSDILEKNRACLIQANTKDLEEQKGKLPSSLFQRLTLSTEKISELVRGLSDLQGLKDPIGERTLHRELDQGLILEKVTTPIGVIGVIFESRPDVAVQIGSLLLKSGNAGVLKGGKEAFHTLQAIEGLVKLLNEQCKFLPQHWLSFIGSRDEVTKMLSQDIYIDLVIPRGSNDLVKAVKAQTKIPVLGHADGICHLYMDRTFDVSDAIALILDSKAQNPSACNALETLLVHRQHYGEVISLLRKNKMGIELIEAPSSWSVEYGDLRLAVKSVFGVEEAISHVNSYGSHHTDVILSQDLVAADQFVREVDSANVFVNCSTRFSDGFRYGFGAEVGISTNKTHARGPVGIEGLTIYKYVLRGKGHRVADYTGAGAKLFSHRNLES